MHGFLRVFPCFVVIIIIIDMLSGSMQVVYCSGMTARVPARPDLDRSIASIIWQLSSMPAEMKGWFVSTACTVNHNQVYGVAAVPVSLLLGTKAGMNFRYSQIGRNALTLR